MRWPGPGPGPGTRVIRTMVGRKNQGMDQERGDGEGQEAKEGKGEVAVEGKGQQGKAKSAARRPTRWTRSVERDTVMRYALKNKDKYDKRKAKVERLNARAAVALMLEGPAQGEKRNMDYKALDVWPCNSPTQQQCAGGFSSASCLFCG